MSNGKRGASGSFPKIDSRSCVQSSCNVRSRNGPLRTTLCASGRSTISHDSPTDRSKGRFLPKSEANFRPPEILSWKTGSKVRGELTLTIELDQTLRVKHQTGFVFVVIR